MKKYMAFLMSLLFMACACGPAVEIIEEPLEEIPMVELSFWADIGVFPELPQLWEQAYDINQNQVIAMSPDQELFIFIKDSRAWVGQSYREKYKEFLETIYLSYKLSDLVSIPNEWYFLKWQEADLYGNMTCLPECKEKHYIHKYFEVSVDFGIGVVIVLFIGPSESFELYHRELMVILESFTGLTEWPEIN